MEVGVVCFPYGASAITDVARVADRAGGPLMFGIPDSPLLFADTYVAQQAVLASTEHLRVGPFSTNPVTRHWGVHAAVHRSLDELYPERTFMAIAPGDSAVHAFGLPPAKPARLQAHAEEVRERGPKGFRLLVAAGGLKASAAAGLASDEVVFGQGFDPGATDQLTGAATNAREQAGIDRPLKRWLYVIADIWESGDGSSDPEERERFRSMLMAYSRQAMSATYTGKNVPKPLQPRLKELYSAFSFERYGDSHNARLLEEFAEEERFLLNRFAVQGTPQEVAAGIRDGVRESRVDGVWIGLLTEQAGTMMELFVDGVLSKLGSETAGT